MMMFIVVEQNNTWIVQSVKGNERKTVAIIPEYYKDKTDREKLAEEIANSLNIYHGYKTPDKKKD